MILWRLAAASNDLHPGARLRCLDTHAGRMAAGDRVVVEYGDGRIALARIARAAPDSVTLAVAAHSTGRGAPAGAKTWQLVPGNRAGELRVRGRGR
jgi:hypothetical protein